MPMLAARRKSTYRSRVTGVTSEIRRNPATIVPAIRSSSCPGASAPSGLTPGGAWVTDLMVVRSGAAAQTDSCSKVGGGDLNIPAGSTHGFLGDRTLRE